MVLDFEYGVHTGNRFLQFVDHDEEPEAFIAAKTKEESEQKKPATTKDVKQPAKKTTPASKTTTSTTSAKTNKENVNTKSTNVEQRRQQSATVPAVFGDNNNQQVRGDSARGARGNSKRGGASFDGAPRGGRSQRFVKFEGQGASSNAESGSAEQGGDSWNTESRGGARGRGGRGRGNFEGGRGSGRPRPRSGRGNMGNRAPEEGAQSDNNWQQNADSNFDQDASNSERNIEPDNTRRTRGNYRGRAFHSNRNHGEREGEEDYRANRRQTDRQPRSFVSGVKPIEKKDGEGAHNWGNPTENPEDHPLPEETAEGAAPASKGWAEQVDEAEKQMTLDEYKKQLEAKKRATQEKLPQFNTRAAGEGEDPKTWHKFEQEYRKKNDDEEYDEEEEEEEENASGDESEEQASGKKKIITIPLRFKPIEVPRGGPGGRGGQRRGGPRRSNRDDQRSTSPSHGQSSPSQYEDQSSFRGGRRGDPRRSTRGSRQGGRNADPNAPALDNPEDFPTLNKQ